MNLKLLYSILIVSLFSGMPCSWAQGWEWAKSAGGAVNENATAVVTDASGNVYVTGTFSSASVQFGSFTLTNTNVGFTDIFLVKYAPGGNVLWASSAGGSDNDYATSLSLDARGNIYVTGYFYSQTIAFGSTTLSNDTNNATCDIYVAKFNSSGSPAWANSAGGTQNDQAASVKADAAGNVVLTGNFASKYLIFGTDTVKNPVATAADVFVIKYDSTGGFVWATNSGGIGDNYGLAITTDAADNIFVSGGFNSTNITFDDSILVNTVAGTDDIFLAKYNAAGTIQWVRGATGSNDDVANALATDASGNVYMTGQFESSTLVFNTFTLNNTGGGYDAFTVKYNASGTPIWAGSIGTGTPGNIITSNYGYSLALDDTNVIIAGNFGNSSVTFGSSTLTDDGASGQYNLFIAKYNSSGAALWANTTGTGGSFANGVATDASGDIYLTGNFSDSSFLFGNNLLLNASNTGTTDMFLAKYILTPLSVANVNLQPYKMALYPNPAEDNINVVFNGEGYNSITVYDCVGRTVYQQQLSGSEQAVVINTSEFTDGVYFVRAMHGDNMANATFVVRK